MWCILNIGTTNRLPIRRFVCVRVCKCRERFSTSASHRWLTNSILACPSFISYRWGFSGMLNTASASDYILIRTARGSLVRFAGCTICINLFSDVENWMWSSIVSRDHKSQVPVMGRVIITIDTQYIIHAIPVSLHRINVSEIIPSEQFIYVALWPSEWTYIIWYRYASVEAYLSRFCVS